MFAIVRGMAFTSADLTNLDKAIATGELSVRAADGKQVTFRSIDELIAARDLISKSLAASASPSSRILPRHQLADFSEDAADG